MPDDDERELLTPAMLDVLGGAAQIMVGVATKSGPHTTPELFTVSSGRLWCLTAATTLKAKLLRDGGVVAAAAVEGDTAVLMLGTARVLDAARPAAAFADNGDAVAAPVAAARFVAQNAVELTGAVVDAFTGKLGALPPRRVLIAIDVSAAALIVAGKVTEATGSTAVAASMGIVKPAAGDTLDALDLVDALPPNLQELAASGPAIVGWTTTTGAPVVLPGRWRAGTSEVAVAAGALEWAGGASVGGVAVVRDAWSGLGPTGKQGLMVRGSGVVTAGGEEATIAIDVSGVTYWDGVETGTVAVD